MKGRIRLASVMVGLALTLAVLGAVSYYQFFRDESCESQFKRETFGRYDPFPPSGADWPEHTDPSGIEFDFRVEGGESVKMVLRQWNATGEVVEYWEPGGSPNVRVIDAGDCVTVWAWRPHVTPSISGVQMEPYEEREHVMEWLGTASFQEGEVRVSPGTYEVYAYHGFYGRVDIQDKPYSLWASPFHKLEVGNSGIVVPSGR